MRSNIPVDMDGLDEYLQNGLVYFYKRDIHYRPVCIINVKKLVKTEIEDEVLLRMTFALVFYTIGKYCFRLWLIIYIEHGMRSGAIENWVVILDLKGVGVTEMPKKKLQTMVGTLQTNFRGRLFRLYAVNMPLMLRVLWNFVKKMLDKFTLQKMSIHGSGFEAEILKTIPAHNLEKRYGGELDNKESDFYPPQLD
jgi:hypothetical protein